MDTVNEIKYYTEFKNYSKLNTDTCSLLGMLKKDKDTEVIELVENEEVVKGLELYSQRPFTEKEFNSVVNAWKSFTNLDIVRVTLS